MCKLSSKNFNVELIPFSSFFFFFFSKIVPGGLWLLSFYMELAWRATAEWIVFGSVASNRQVKRGEMIIDRRFNAAVRLNKTTGQIPSQNPGENPSFSPLQADGWSGGDSDREAEAVMK